MREPLKTAAYQALTTWAHAGGTCGIRMRCKPYGDPGTFRRRSHRVRKRPRLASGHPCGELDSRATPRFKKMKRFSCRIESFYFQSIFTRFSLKKLKSAVTRNHASGLVLKINWARYHDLPHPPRRRIKNFIRIVSYQNSANSHPNHACIVPQI